MLKAQGSKVKGNRQVVRGQAEKAKRIDEEKYQSLKHAIPNNFQLPDLHPYFRQAVDKVRNLSSP